MLQFDERRLLLLLPGRYRRLLRRHGHLPLHPQPALLGLGGAYLRD
jgi:hypothetical protein